MLEQRQGICKYMYLSNLLCVDPWYVYCIHAFKKSYASKMHTAKYPTGYQSDTSTINVNSCITMQNICLDFITEYLCITGIFNIVWNFTPAYLMDCLPNSVLGWGKVSSGLRHALVPYE